MGSTFKQQPVGKLVQQSFGEAPRVKLSNPNPIQSVIDQGNLRTQNLFLWIKEKRPVHKRSMINVCTKNFALSDRTGKLVKLSEDIRVMHAHDGTGEPVKSSASTHTVKEFVPAEHRNIASSNADNEFNRASDEENIDFNMCQIRR